MVATLWCVYWTKQSRVDFLLLQRLYREDYHKHKDKIHTTYDTPDIKQVKMNQAHLSDVQNQFSCHSCSWFYSCSIIIISVRICSIHATSCFLHILAVVQREVLQQQRPADLHAHYTRADALLPRQSHLQWGTVERVNYFQIMGFKCNKLFAEFYFVVVVFSWNTKRILFGWEALAASCMTLQRWSMFATSPNKGYVFTHLWQISLYNISLYFNN